MTPNQPFCRASSRESWVPKSSLRLRGVLPRQNAHLSVTVADLRLPVVLMYAGGGKHARKTGRFPGRIYWVPWIFHFVRLAVAHLFVGLQLVLRPVFSRLNMQVRLLLVVDSFRGQNSPVFEYVLKHKITKVLNHVKN